MIEGLSPSASMDHGHCRMDHGQEDESKLVLDAADALLMLAAQPPPPRQDEASIEAANTLVGMLLMKHAGLPALDNVKPEGGEGVLIDTRDTGKAALLDGEGDTGKAAELLVGEGDKVADTGKADPVADTGKAAELLVREGDKVADTRKAGLLVREGDHVKPGVMLFVKSEDMLKYLEVADEDEEDAVLPCS